MSVSWKIEAGDCVEQAAKWLAAGLRPKLLVNDVPYNLGRNYDVYDDARPVLEYLNWTKEWGQAAYDWVHPQGWLWVAIYPSLVSEVDVALKSLGWHKRYQIPWLFSFGVNNAKGFTRAHTYWLVYSRHKTKWHFNAADPELRHPSARQLKYKDKRANPAGRLPDDAWILDLDNLRKELNQDLDWWIESRIAGTFSERIKGSDNQLPRALVDRIVRACSSPGDLVADMFGGTFTTGESCLALGRDFVGCDVSLDYVKRGRERLAAFELSIGPQSEKKKRKKR